MDANEVEVAAKTHAKLIRNEVAREMIECPVGNDEEPPITILMAGAPGAGKTEASKEMLRDFNILRLDPDDLRSRFPQYDGGNSSLFQGAVSLVVERVFDKLVKSRKSFLLDGTSANLNKTRSNIARAVRAGRHVRLWYVYQDPALSWTFVEAREKTEGRGIPLEAFVDQYFNSRFVVREMKEEFGDELYVDVLVKDLDQDETKYYEDVASVDDVCPSSRTRDELREILNQKEA
ncbi:MULTISPECIES: zeta toxin family protein [unclassified Halomonas]|uniref:zeta toxin family protein n=1 Tax=unclassified Halomonas TaxID=2609666 RepID=UPI00209F7BBB|nr:zeta toxin family protein [Halomonas sp. DN3]USZ48105.1 zeta toxin family protein [Halomonas sp. DN3]